MRKPYALALSLLMVGAVALTYLTFQSSTKNPLVISPTLEQVVVSKDIDGDTLDLSDGRRLRLANINAFEKNHPLSQQARSYLQSLENQTLSVKIIGKDNRGTRYVAELYTLDRPPVYINLAMVKNGLAPKAWVADDQKKIFSDAEKEAVSNERGIWKYSPHYSCLTAVIDEKNEVLTLENACSEFSLAGAYLKDESRLIYTFPESADKYMKTTTLNSSKGQNHDTVFYWNQAASVWNNDRDTLYIFDTQNRLLLYHSYGY